MTAAPEPTTAISATPTADDEGLELLPDDPMVEDAERHASLLVQRIRHSDPSAVKDTLQSILQGLPPFALEPILDAMQAHPHIAWAQALDSLIHYRDVQVRVRALLALAAQPGHGRDAALAAMSDPERRIRRLGLMLVEQHTDPQLEEMALLLRAREPDLTAP